jgi:hypothetical protein
MTKLNQIVAIEKGVKTDVAKKVTRIYHEAQKVQLFGGIARTYRPKEDGGDTFPDESTLVQLRADALLVDMGKDLTALFDTVATKDFANTVAKADVVVDGEVILVQAPVTYLLFLEKHLAETVRTVITKMPTLDPAVQWHWDSATGTWATDPVETHRSKKVPRVLVKAPATDKHPAQVDVGQEDIVDGYWSTTKFSGALPVDRVNLLLERVDTLIKAVKFAREEANSIPVTDITVGNKVFNYLLAD